MPATHNLRDHSRPPAANRPCAGLEALEARALLSAAAVCPQGDPAVGGATAPLSVPASHQPANRAEAVAEAMKALGLDPVAPAANPAATATPSTRHSRHRRVKPLAIRVHHPVPATSTPPRTTVSSLFFPSEAAAQVDAANGNAAAPAVFGEEANAVSPSAIADVTSGGTAAFAVGELSTVARPRPAIATATPPAVLVSQPASPFGNTPIVATLAPTAVTEFARAGAAASSVFALAGGQLPDWLIVVPQGDYVFTDRELFFKAGVMVLSVAGLIAGYCSYLQITRSRQQAEDRAKVQNYALFGWQESF